MKVKGRATPTAAKYSSMNNSRALHKFFGYNCVQVRQYNTATEKDNTDIDCHVHASICIKYLPSEQ